MNCGHVAVKKTEGLDSNFAHPAMNCQAIIRRPYRAPKVP